MEKLELLYDHYKETFNIGEEARKERNKCFVYLCYCIAVHYLFSLEPSGVLMSFFRWLDLEHKISIAIPITVVQGFLWMILLYLSVRYYQLQIMIERSYKYLKQVEEIFVESTNYPFNREGWGYLNHRPKTLKMIHFLYNLLFPIIFIILIIVKLVSEWKQYFDIVSAIFDTFIASIVIALVILHSIFMRLGFPSKKVKAKETVSL